MKNHNLYIPKPGQSTNKHDFQTVEWGREANASWIIGKSSNPVFFTQDGHNVKLEDSAKGASVLICDDTIDLTLNLSNTHVWAVGDAVKRYPCSIWTPDLNVESYEVDYWTSPAYLKILPLQMARSRRKDGKLISHSPFCFYYRRHNSFNAAEFMNEETIWFDGSAGSNLLASLKLAIIIGYRKIFIASNIDKSTKSFQLLQQINKMMNSEYLNIYDCGNLDLFPKMSLDEACRQCILR